LTTTFDTTAMAQTTSSQPKELIQAALLNLDSTLL